MSNTAYATIADVTTLWRALTPDETTRANALLPDISDALRYEAIKVGCDLDAMIAETPVLASVAKDVTVDILSRILRASTTGEAMTQESQTILGYTWQGTYANPDRGIASSILRNDLKRLGLKRQKYGYFEPYTQATEVQHETE